jgi:hypothetical protein
LAPAQNLKEEIARLLKEGEGKFSPYQIEYLNRIIAPDARRPESELRTASQKARDFLEHQAAEQQTSKQHASEQQSVAEQAGVKIALPEHRGTEPVKVATAAGRKKRT